MSEKKDKSVGHFFCVACSGTVVVQASENVEDFRVGVNLFCPECDNRISIGVVKSLIADTGIPKTYRKMFEKYLEWKGEKN